MTLYPFYKGGMIDNRADFADDDTDSILHLRYDRNILQTPNINLSILLTSKTIHKIGTNLFYSSNKFKFWDPDACS